MKLIASWEIPVKTVSESNRSEHWAKKAKRHKLQKRWVKATWPHAMPPLDPEATYTICITRIAPRVLDLHDNLPSSVKWILDGICDNLYPGLAIGQADSAKNLKWAYYQIKRNPKEYAVQVQIWKNE